MSLSVVFGRLGKPATGYLLQLLTESSSTTKNIMTREISFSSQEVSTTDVGKQIDNCADIRDQ